MWHKSKSKQNKRRSPFFTIGALQTEKKLTLGLGLAKKPESLPVAGEERKDNEFINSKDSSIEHKPSPSHLMMP